MASNKKLGNRYENKVANYLAEKGFWVHILQQNKSGQPADLIVVNKKGIAFLIDCKECSTQGFYLSRLEENQDLAMTKFREVSGNTGWFAIGFKNIDYMVSHLDLKAIKDMGYTKLLQPNLKKGTITLEMWAEIYVDYSGKQVDL